MSELKTHVNDESVEKFLNSVEGEQKRADSFVLLDMFTRVSGEQAKMWGSSMIGFGMYHHRSECSKQQGDWPRLAFSPRKQSLTIYLMPGFDDVKDELSALGKHKTSVGCLYINKLADIDLKILQKIIEKTLKEMNRQYPAG